MKNRKIGSVQNLGDGKYRLRILAGFDDYGRRIQPSKVVKASSDTEAEKALIKFYAEREKLAEKHISKPPETLGELYEEYKKNHLSTLELNTQDYYHNLWDKHLESRKKAKLTRITPKTIYDILKDSADKPRVQKAVYGMLFTMLRKAVGWGYLEKNPCERVETPKYKAKEKRPYTEAELDKVIEAVENETLSFQIIFYLAAMLGMRRSEIVGLKWPDVNFDAGTLSIRRSAARKAGEGTYISGTKNKRSERTLYIDGMILDKLRAHRAAQSERQLPKSNRATCF